MISLLRKIRKSLIDSGSTRKYFFYAFGEITLVVIGILIALQINNWNESQKKQRIEVEMLKEVAENLETNTIRLKSMIGRCNADNHSVDIIISVIENNIPFSDSLNSHFYFALNPIDDGSFLSYVGFESLKNVGFEIIGNDQIKREIVYLFEGVYQDLQHKYSRSNLISTPNLTTFRDQHFLFHVDTIKQQIGHRPVDFDRLVENEYFKSWLLSTKGIRLWVRNSLQESLSETERVQKLILKELGEEIILI
jgi:hypothetical protein